MEGTVVPHVTGSHQQHLPASEQKGPSLRFAQYPSWRPWEIRRFPFLSRWVAFWPEGVVSTDTFCPKAFIQSWRKILTCLRVLAVDGHSHKHGFFMQL